MARQNAEQALTGAIDLAESEPTRLTLITGIQKLPPIAYAGLTAEGSSLHGVVPPRGRPPERPPSVRRR